MLTKRFFIVFVLVLISACSTSDNAIYHSGFNFSLVNSYSFYERNSDFDDHQNLSDSQRNRIELAIEKGMANEKLQYKELDKADIIVTYHLVNKASDYKNYNKAVLFCQQCLQANNWRKGSHKLKVTRNSLIIDLIDPQRSRSVWRSIQSLQFKPKDNSQEVNKKIQEAVNEMLIQLPK